MMTPASPFAINQIMLYRKAVSFFPEAGHCMNGSLFDPSTSQASDTLAPIKKIPEKL
jgi:hypothetical protein